MRRIKDIELDQDLDLQRREWVAQRIGWAAMLLAILAGLAGVFGNGPFSVAARTSADGNTRIEYPRFARFDSPTSLRVVARGDAAGGDELRVYISARYLEKVQIQRVVPEPERAVLADEVVAYVFPLFGPSRAAGVTYYFTIKTIGRMSGQVRVGNGEPLAISQFVYP